MGDWSLAQEFRKELPLVGLGSAFCLFYWLAEGFVESQIFQLGPFWERVVAPDPQQITERIAVSILIIALAVAARSLLTHRRQYEAQVRADEERYQRLIESAQEGIWIIDPFQRTTYVNPRMAAMLGYTVEEMAGRPLFDFVDARGTNTASESLRRGTGSREAYDLAFASKDGRRVLTRMSTSPVLNGEGEYAGALAFVTDVTVEREALSALRLSEEKFANAFRLSPDAITISRLGDGVLMEVNDGFTRLTGYAPEEAVGRSLRTLGMWASMEDGGRMRDLLRDHGTLRDHEVPLRTKDGSEKIGSISATLLEVGPDRLVLATTRDVTEQRRAEEALRRSEELYRNIYSTGALAFVIWRADRRILDWNRRAEELFGWSKEEVLGLDFFDVMVPSSQRANVEAFVRDILQTRRGSVNVNQNATKDGRVILCEWYNAILHDRSGQVEAVVSMGLDVTERQAAADRLRASLEEKEALLREVHHRVKNNLQIVSTLLSLQGAQTSDTGERALLKESQSRVRSMSLVHEKLYQAPNLARVDFGAYLSDLAAQLFRVYGMDRGRVTPVIAVAGAELPMDTAINLGLIVNELMTNSLKYAFPNDRKGEVRISMSRNGRWSLVVEDDGVGLPEGLDYRATGTLGLMLVMTLVAQMRGEIRLASAPGTRYTITFDGLS